MKNIFRLFATLFLLIGSSLGGNASAQIIAYDNATNYTTWTSGEDLGFGFGPWALIETNTPGTGFAGFYIGNPNGQGGIQQPPGKAFGMYANGAGDNDAVAFRSFSNSLPTNVVFKVQWANHGIGSGFTNRAGFSLRTGNATNS